MQTTVNQKSSALPTGCLIAFCLPFCLVGIMALVVAIFKALGPAPRLIDVFGLGAFGLVFALVGFGVLQAGYQGMKKLAEVARRRELYPQAAWMWREDWSHGRVQGTTRASMAMSWVIAVSWNLISAPVIYLVSQNWATNRVALLGLLFPLLGVVLLFNALRQTIRWKEFGKTWFDIGTLPGVIGGELRGSINVHFPWPPEGGVVLKLSCVNRVVKSSGKNQSTSEKILWQDDHALPAGQIQSGPIGSSIPVTFQIPIDALETNSNDPRNSILWVLEADANTPGVSYRDTFEVPVFRTKDTPQETPGEIATAPFSMATEAAPPEKPLDSRIVVQPSDMGGTEYDFSAARNVGMAGPTTVFFLIWTGVVWFIIHMKAPLLFPIVFGGFDIILFLIVLSLWLGTSKVVIGSGSVMVRRGILGIGRTREIPFSQIDAIAMPVGMQSGGRTGVPFYDIKLKLSDGKEATLASAIRNKHEALWLVARMKSEIGLKA